MNLKRTVRVLFAKAYDNRAMIETVAGMICVAAGAGVIISKAKQAANIACNIESNLDEIHKKDATDAWVDKKERSVAVRGNLSYAVCEYTKTYALGVALIVGGEVLQGFGYATKCQQLTTATTLAASYAATLNAIKDRVIADQGEEKWQEYLLGPQFTTVDVMPDGTIIQTTEPVADHNGNIGLPPHCFFFDNCNCPNTWEKDPYINRDFLENHQRWLNERLWVEGFLFENDIRRDLGAPLVKSGWTSGILAEDKDGNRNWLDLGLGAKNPAAQAFRDGTEPSILIQMNVEDNIIDQLKLELV